MQATEVKWKESIFHFFRSVSDLLAFPRSLLYAHEFAVRAPENMWNISEEVISMLVEYIFANNDAFYLLISKSAGSAYENFVDQLVAEREKQTYEFQQEMIRRGYPCRALTPDEIHVLLSAQYYAIFEIVRHKLEKEEALDRIRLIADFFGSAWKLYFA